MSLWRHQRAVEGSRGGIDSIPEAIQEISPLWLGAEGHLLASEHPPSR